MTTWKNDRMTARPTDPGSSPGWRRPDHVVSREIDGEIVLLDLERGEYHHLEEVAVAVWQGLGEGLGEPALVDRIVERWDVDRETACRDLLAFLSELESAGLIESG